MLLNISSKGGGGGEIMPGSWKELMENCLPPSLDVRSTQMDLLTTQYLDFGK